MILPITINLTTRGRYNTTLPLCLMSIVNQTLIPYEVILVDDNIDKLFYSNPVFKEILRLFKIKNIKFSYFYGESRGQTYAQQIAFNNTKTPFILKLDDDNVLEPLVLEHLFNTINLNSKIGAVSGLVLGPQDYFREINHTSKEIYNKLEDIYCGFNIQMCGLQDYTLKKVEHIYSNFLFKKELVEGYCTEFSPSGHREDTILTHEIYRKGYDLIIHPKSITHHLSSSEGGNKIYSSKHVLKNELLFIEKLKEWGIIPNKITLEEDENNVFIRKYNSKWLVYKK